MRTLAKIAAPFGRRESVSCRGRGAGRDQDPVQLLRAAPAPAQGRDHRQLVEAGHGGQRRTHPGELSGEDPWRPAPRQWKMITSGIADATVMYNNFERKRLSLDQVGTLPFSITDAASTATALWRTHKKYFEAKNQVQGRQVPRLRHARRRRAVQPQGPHPVRGRHEADEAALAAGRRRQGGRQERGGSGTHTGRQGVRRGVQGDRRRAGLPHRRRLEAQDDALTSSTSPRCRARCMARYSRST